MNSSLVDWLFGMSKFGFSDPNTRFALEHELDVWLWVLICVAALVMAAWSYSRLVGPQSIRLVLTTVRTLLIVLVALLLIGPVRVKDNHQVIEDWLLVMVDQSASMQQKDVASKDPTSADQYLERYEAVRQSLDRQQKVFDETRLGRDRRIAWFGFDSRVRRVQPPFEQTDGAKPQGRRTLLASAIQDVLKANAGRRVRGILLLTDGRTPQATGQGLARQLDRDSIKVFPVPVGARKPKLDLVLSQPIAPSRAFVNDAVSVRVSVDHQQSDLPVDPSRVRLKLRDQASGRLLDEKTLGERGFEQPVQLSATWAKDETVTWRVELEYLPINEQESERNTANNQQTLRIRFIDRPLRVLLIEGYPRWEYRYLKELIRQEKTIEASVMLVSADTGFAQEGDVPIARLPRDLDELAPFDVLIIGDVPSDYLGTELMSVIRDHVSTRGAGLIWIAGPYNTPQTYTGTPLLDLLPMRQPSLVRRLELGGAVAQARARSSARALNLLRVDVDSNNPNPTTLSGLPGFYWVQNVGELKQGVEVLAEAGPSPQQQAPLLTLMRHGAGRCMYLATDEIWRWRYGRGSKPTQQFWIPLIQYLGWARGRQNDQLAWMNVSAKKAVVDQTLVVKVQMRQGVVLPRVLPRLRVNVRRVGDPTGKIVDSFEVIRQQSDNQAQASAGQSYTAQWRSAQSGQFVLQLDEPSLVDADVRQTVLIEHPDDESRYTTADYQRLEVLAKNTGGQVLQLDQLQSLVDLIPPDPEKITISVKESLWDCPLTLILFGLLLTLEWAGRKLIRLI